MNTECEVCAPIIIPTLNRVEHLKKCIDSLKKSEWARNTEIYISVDYPPNEKYTKGYEAVKEYVYSGIDGFKNVRYFIQTKNLGPYKNIQFLINEVYKEYDRFIFTEDDNVFSPAAIEYWNRGLVKYEKDERIIAVCSRYWERYAVIIKGNVYLCQAFQHMDMLHGKVRSNNIKKKSICK